MNETVLMGQESNITTIPREEWEALLSAIPEHVGPKLEFMSQEHHLVRNFVVKELPTAGRPLSPELISRRLNLTVPGTVELLDDLEKNLTFLFRNEGGEVVWAYPVTVDKTPHHITFNTGEQLYGAWAIDAVATPFVQGRLRGEPVSTVIRTECAHCGRSMVIEMDSEDSVTVVEGGKTPLVFHPFVDFAAVTEPSIIDVF